MGANKHILCSKKHNLYINLYEFILIRYKSNNKCKIYASNV